MYPFNLFVLGSRFQNSIAMAFNIKQNEHLIFIFIKILKKKKKKKNFFYFFIFFFYYKKIFFFFFFFFFFIKK